MGSAVQITHLTKSYGDLVAVNDVSFEVKEGEIFGLLGPNGAGKTTTLKVLMGLLDADGGSVRVYGVDVGQDPLEVRRVVGYVPEEQRLYESLTPRELFEFVASVRGLPEGKVSRRLQEMVRALLGLTEAPRPDDAADALAVAICHIHSLRLRSILEDS